MVTKLPPEVLKLAAKGGQLYVTYAVRNQEPSVVSVSSDAEFDRLLQTLRDTRFYKLWIVVQSGGYGAERPIELSDLVQIRENYWSPVTQ